MASSMFFTISPSSVSPVISSSRLKNKVSGSSCLASSCSAVVGLVPLEQEVTESEQLLHDRCRQAQFKFGQSGLKADRAHAAGDLL